MNSAHSRFGRVAIAVIAVALLSVTACAHVASYERGALAHPTMTTADPTGPGEAHARDVQEGAVGGGFSAGGGCGCN